jgi:transposase
LSRMASRYSAMACSTRLLSRRALPRLLWAVLYCGTRLIWPSSENLQHRLAKRMVLADNGGMQEAKYSTYEVRVRAVQAVQGGMAVTQVAQAYQIDRTTLHRWLARYHLMGGPRGLTRLHGSGRPRKLQEMTPEQWRAVILEPASSFGFETDFWTAKRVHQVMTQHFGVSVSSRTIVRRLQEAGLSYQKPTREYFEADPVARQEWLRSTLPKIRSAIRDYRAILYCEDEASISLTALLGKTWAVRGQTPKQKVTGKRGSVPVMSAINAQGRLVFRLYDKRITSTEVIEFLQQLLWEHPRRHLVVVMDQAPPHTSQQTAAFIAGQRRLHVFHLPTYSPDWNPDEKVWNHLKHQELKGHQAKTKIEIKDLAERKLTTMSQNPALLRGIYFRCCVADLLS